MLTFILNGRYFQLGIIQHVIYLNRQTGRKEYKINVYRENRSGKSRMHNPEKLATLGTQDTG